MDPAAMIESVLTHNSIMPARVRVWWKFMSAASDPSRSHSRLKCLGDPLLWRSYITGDFLIIKMPLFQPCKVRCIALHIYQDGDKNSSPPITSCQFGSITSNPATCSFIKEICWVLSKGGTFLEKKNIFSCVLFCFGGRRAGVYSIMSKRFNETCLISFPCCWCPDLSEWMITFMYESSGPPAFIATHFGKILPVLAVNSEAPFVWKIFHRATHNMSDCRFLWTPHSNPRHILSFPVTYEEGKQLCLTYNHFFFFPDEKKTLHIASCFVHREWLLLWRFRWVEKIAFSLWSLLVAA